jgi:Zn-dependent protease with chaperone function
MTVLTGSVVGVERVDRITAQARQWPAGRTLLSLVAAVLVGVGRLTFAVFASLWLVLTWCAAAVKVGWDDARQAQQARAAEAMKRAGDGVDS